MSRRDTIIVAVLVNTGLLAILFVMALSPSDERLMEPVDINRAFVHAYDNAAPEPDAVQIAFVREGSDEVDSVLKDFAATVNADTFVREDNRSAFAAREEIAMTEIQPLPKKTTASAGEPEYIEITVKKGDILGKIARSNGTTVSAIKKANNMTTDKLNVGQVLRIPLNSKREMLQQPQLAETPTKAASDTTGTAQYYVVENGDNPWKIAKKFHVSVNELLRINNLNEAKARNLKPGDRIRVQ